MFTNEEVTKIVDNLFFNFKDVHEINSALLVNLVKRQNKNILISKIGDIFLQWSIDLDPFMKYGKHLVFALDFLNNDLNNNLCFHEILSEAEKDPNSRRLSIKSFMNSITTRLGRYPLLLEGILKNTKTSSEEDSDGFLIPIAVSNIRCALAKIDELTGESEKQIVLNSLIRQLSLKNVVKKNVNI